MKGYDFKKEMHVQIGGRDQNYGFFFPNSKMLLIICVMLHVHTFTQEREMKYLKVEQLKADACFL